MKNEVNINTILAKMFSGYSFRKKVRHDPKGSLKVIQMKDLENNYSSIGDNLSRVDSSSIPERYLLLKGDVLFISKGSNNFAIEYDLDIPNVVASSAFFVLRPDTSKVFPAYLAWCINQTPIQRYLKGNMAGTYVPNINKGTVEGMNIMLPPMDDQIAIASLQKLADRESRILQKLAAKRRLLLQKTLVDRVYQ